MTERTCSIGGCEKPVEPQRRLCRMHRKRLQNHGDVNWTPVRLSPLERLMARTIVTPGPLDTDCWLCSLRTNGPGYAHVQLGGRGSRNVQGHRVVYEAHRGPIPDGLELDHLCRVRNCVNPDHLEPVTTRENFLRGEARGAVTARTNVCQRGHSMEDAYVRPNGARMCRECRRLTRKKWN